ncbi:MAG: hypothetical protein JXA25_13510 [Anaerolineales bacterium]|nr:hypothetical protein [Anaerolineales bacterium]
MPERKKYTDRVVFLTAVCSAGQVIGARMLQDSIRLFTGSFCSSPLWIYTTRETETDCKALASGRTEIILLDIPEAARNAWFSGKVGACAQAEKAASAGVERLIWVSPDTLFFQPPHELDIKEGVDVAVRPVHITNVGLRAEQPLDVFWSGVYQVVGAEEVTQTVESFVDRQILRPYFNSHLVAVDPRRGLFQRWLEFFTLLAADEQYQRAACDNVPHRVFLHQAVLSVLLAGVMAEERLLILPPSYSYPYNLHDQIPQDRKAHSLNELVCAAVEDRKLDPDQITDIEIAEPLRSWLSQHCQKC